MQESKKGFTFGTLLNFYKMIKLFESIGKVHRQVTARSNAAAAFPVDFFYVKK